MSLRQDLIAAKALVDTPAKWAAGGKGRPSRLDVADACFKISRPSENDFAHLDCLVWMLDQAVPPKYRNTRGMGAGPHRPSIRFNDDPTTTHADIMAPVRPRNQRGPMMYRKVGLPFAIG